MITGDGWFDWMDRVSGPPDKVYAKRNTAKIYLPHSAVGYYGGWASRLFSTDRTGTCIHGGVHLPVGGDYTAYAAASVTGWIPYSGPVLQHYSIFKSCWASGSWYPNTNGIAFENEGGAPGNFMQPLNPYQIEVNTRIALDLQEYHKSNGDDYGWDVPRRPTSESDLNAQLYEHNECTRWGSRPTACPSERLRYAWPIILSALNEEQEPEDMTDSRLDQIYMKLGADEPVLFTVMDNGAPNGRKDIPLSRLDWMNYRAYGFILSDAKISSELRNQTIAHLVQPHPAPSGPDHLHSIDGAQTGPPENE